MRFNNMGIMLSQYIIIITLVAITASCSDVGSGDVKTSEIHAGIRVYATQDNASFVNVQLSLGSGFGAPGIDLGSGDSITVTANGITLPLEKYIDTANNIYNYENFFDFADEDTRYVISLNRYNGVSAPNSSVSIPSPFTINTPEDDQIFLYDEQINVSWSPTNTDDSVRLLRALTCTSIDGGPTGVLDHVAGMGRPDSGNITIDMRDLVNILQNIDTSKNCIARISLERIRFGQIDENFEQGSSIMAVQKQVATVNISF